MRINIILVLLVFLFISLTLFTYPISANEGDLNNDGIVDVFDLILVASHYGLTPSDPDWDPSVDTDGNNRIELIDLAEVSVNLGNTYTISCTGHDYFDCYGSDVYWYDSCDVNEELKEDCDVGCYEGQCTSIPNATYGWDYNLEKRCVKSPHPNQSNYYEDLTECGPSGESWTIAVQAEQALGESCVGVQTQSLPIDDPNGLTTMNWYPHVDEFGNDNWRVNLHTDVSSKTHPCGDNTYTWVMFMDHIGHGGGPFPRPDHVLFSADINFNDFTPNGATRAIAEWSGWWDGKARIIELTFQGSNWDDAYPGDPYIVTYINNDQMEFVLVEGSAWGITVPKLETTTLVIDWSAIIQDLITKGFLKNPSGGWASTETTSVGIAHEAYAWSASQAVISDLWISNFRITSIEKDPTGYIDSLTCQEIMGWAVDMDTPDESIRVHIYKDGPVGTGTLVTETTANIFRQDVNDYYGITGDHGFSMPLPGSISDGQTHDIYAYGIDSSGGVNSLLTNSPKTLDTSSC